jgi:outer membrane autotransporter protein
MGILSYAKLFAPFFFLAKMIKATLATVAIAALAPVGAIAGPYVNVETNAGWTGSEYGGAATDLHVGYEGTAGAASYYIQGGPQVQLPNGGDSETVFSAKAGGGVGLTEKLSAYGEVSLVTAGKTDQNGYGGKLGLKYSF